MRMLIMLAWLMVPVVAGAYHFGPGQDHLAAERVAAIIAQAESHADAEEWAQAEQQYEAALQLLPAEDVATARRLRLERAKAQMFVKKLPAAHAELKGLVDELSEDAKADPKVLAESRAALANSRYYMTWLMRLEGKPKEKWMPEVEAARQTYRLLAAKYEKEGNATAAKSCRQDLESTIRLARMDLSDLQGLPLPSQ